MKWVYILQLLVMLHSTHLNPCLQHGCVCETTMYSAQTASKMDKVTCRQDFKFCCKLFVVMYKATNLSLGAAI